MPIRLRFVTCSDPLSTIIREREGAVIPFTPSHVEAVVAEGYLGAHYEGGVAIRPVGYDQATLLHELFVELATDPGRDQAFETFIRGKLGAPYDWQAIIDFVLPVNLHENKHLICSAFMTLAVRACGALPYPLVVPAHQISPRDLLLTLSGRIDVPVQPAPRA